MNMYSKIMVALSLILSLVVGVFAGYLLYPAISIEKDVDQCVEDNDSSGTDCSEFNNQFYSDRVILASPVQADKEMFLLLDLNRKQKSANEYSHYYSGFLLYEGRVDEVYARTSDRGSRVIAFDYIEDIHNEPFSDLSTRENYQLSLSIEERQIGISITGLEGDFITRNTPDYTRYVSTGQAEVVVDGQDILTFAMLSKIYSPNYTKSIFFDGFREIKNTTDYIVAWDEDGAFYLVDNTEVEQLNSQYPSHTWALHKDIRGGTYKAFTAEVDFGNDGGSAVWSVSLPQLGESQIEIDLLLAIETGAARGTVEGTVEDESGVRLLRGYANHITPDTRWW